MWRSTNCKTQTKIRIENKVQKRAVISYKEASRSNISWVYRIKRVTHEVFISAHSILFEQSEQKSAPVVGSQNVPGTLATCNSPTLHIMELLWLFTILVTRIRIEFDYNRKQHFNVKWLIMSFSEVAFLSNLHSNKDGDVMYPKSEDCISGDVTSRSRVGLSSSSLSR